MSEQDSTFQFGSFDLSKPNAARMYDYYLGGSHNFEADRQAAEQITRVIPWVPKAARLQRACLQDIAVELSGARGYDVIVDFASGLPTQDHIHTVVKPGTLVIYSDIDPIVIEFARDILKDVPNAYIFQGDAREPQKLLENPQVQELLRGRRNIAFILWGLATFLNDDELSRIMRELHEWAGPQSTLAFNAQGADIDKDDPAVAHNVALYEKMGVKLTMRTLSQYQELVKPWRPDSAGFVPLLQWHGLDTSIMTPEELKIWSAAGGGHGAYLVKDQTP
jgi:O-methyltransferase involved in polyketide biosynthesis